MDDSSLLLLGPVLAASGWLVRRRFAARRIRALPHARSRSERVCPTVDPARLAHAHVLASERLWRLCYASRPQAPPSESISRRVRENVEALLRVDVLKLEFFPRRPALLPQLMQALDDPRSASERIARMIELDPVLAADVLRMANSSLYRTPAGRIGTVRRALAVCGLDALRAMLATAMLRPVFRATSRNFPRLPRLLWRRTELAVPIGERYSAARGMDRFESAFVVLVNALGPLVLHGAIGDVYSRNPRFAVDAKMCADLTLQLAPQVAQRIVAEWQMPERFATALSGSGSGPLAEVLAMAELLGTMVLLDSQHALEASQRRDWLEGAGIDAQLAADLGAPSTASDADDKVSGVR